MIEIVKKNFISVFETELLDEISLCKIVDFEPNSYLLHEGDNIRFIPLVISGSIKVIRNDDSGREILLYHIAQGESCILTITACLNLKTSKALAITDKQTKLILVSAQQIIRWTDIYKSWRTFVMKLYYARLVELLTLVDAVAFKHIDQRIVEKLKEKSQNGIVNITHQELANELGTAREVVSRLLKQLEKDNKIAISRGKIKIIAPL